MKIGTLKSFIKYIYHILIYFKHAYRSSTASAVAGDATSKIRSLHEIRRRIESRSEIECSIRHQYLRLPHLNITSMIECNHVLAAAQRV